MALMEIDQVAVDGSTWAKARAGDESARDALRARLDGERIYLHAMPVEASEIVVTLRELDAANVLGSVVLSCNPMFGPAIKVARRGE